MSRQWCRFGRNFGRNVWSRWYRIFPPCWSSHPIAASSSIAPPSSHSCTVPPTLQPRCAHSWEGQGIASKSSQSEIRNPLISCTLRRVPCAIGFCCTGPLPFLQSQCCIWLRGFSSAPGSWGWEKLVYGKWAGNNPRRYLFPFCCLF